MCKHPQRKTGIAIFNRFHHIPRILLLLDKTGKFTSKNLFKMVKSQLKKVRMRTYKNLNKVSRRQNKHPHI